MKVTSSGWQAGATVQAVLHSDPVALGGLVADTAGAITGSLVVPSNVASGTHTLSLSGMSAAGATMDLSTSLTVTDDVTAGTSTTPPIGTLARTGASIIHAAWSGYGFLVAGALLVISAVLREQRGRA